MSYNTKDSTDEQLLLKIAYYGPKGCGKTSFFKTMPAPRFMVNFEKENVLPLKMTKSDVEIEDISVMTEKKDAYEKLINVILELDKRFREGRGPKSVCVDTGRDMQLAVANYIMGCKGQKNLTLPDWGHCHNNFYDRLMDFLRFPCHFLITFHEGYDKDEATQQIIGGIALQGTYLPGDVLKKFNMLLHGVFDKAPNGDLIRRVETQKRSIWPADDKTGTLLPLEEPDFEKMWAKIQAKRAQAQTK